VLAVNAAVVDAPDAEVVGGAGGAPVVVPEEDATLGVEVVLWVVLVEALGCQSPDIIKLTVLLVPGVTDAKVVLGVLTRTDTPAD